MTNLAWEARCRACIDAAAARRSRGDAARLLAVSRTVGAVFRHGMMRPVRRETRQPAANRRPARPKAFAVEPTATVRAAHLRFPGGGEPNRTRGPFG